MLNNEKWEKDENWILSYLPLCPFLTKKKEKTGTDYVEGDENKVMKN